MVEGWHHVCCLNPTNAKIHISQRGGLGTFPPLHLSSFLSNKRPPFLYKSTTTLPSLPQLLLLLLVNLVVTQGILLGLSWKNEFEATKMIWKEDNFEGESFCLSRVQRSFQERSRFSPHKFHTGGHRNEKEMVVSIYNSRYTSSSHGPQILTFFTKSLTSFDCLLLPKLAKCRVGGSKLNCLGFGLPGSQSN